MFTEDNFVSADLDALIDTGGALTNLNYRATKINKPSANLTKGLFFIHTGFTRSLKILYVQP